MTSPSLYHSTSGVESQSATHSGDAQRDDSSHAGHVSATAGHEQVADSVPSTGSGVPRRTYQQELDDEQALVQERTRILRNRMEERRKAKAFALASRSGSQDAPPDATTKAPLAAANPSADIPMANGSQTVVPAKEQDHDEEPLDLRQREADGKLAKATPSRPEQQDLYDQTGHSDRKEHSKKLVTPASLDLKSHATAEGLEDHIPFQIDADVMSRSPISPWANVEADDVDDVDMLAGNEAGTGVSKTMADPVATSGVADVLGTVSDHDFWNADTTGESSLETVMQGESGSEANEQERYSDGDSDDDSDGGLSDVIVTDANSMPLTAEQMCMEKRKRTMEGAIRYSYIMAELHQLRSTSPMFAIPLIEVAEHYRVVDLMREDVQADPDLANPIRGGITISTTGLPEGVELCSLTLEQWIALVPGDSDILHGWYGDSVIEIAVLLRSGGAKSGAHFSPPALSYEWLGNTKFGSPKHVSEFDKAISSMVEGNRDSVRNLLPCSDMPGDTTELHTVINIGDHWIAVTIEPEPRAPSRSGLITYYDSLPSQGHDERIRTIMPKFATLVGLREDVMWAQTNWQIRQGRTILQANGIDCGPIAAHNCRQLLCGQDPVVDLLDESSEDFGNQLRYDLLSEMYQRMFGKRISEASLTSDQQGQVTDLAQDGDHLVFDQADIAAPVLSDNLVVNLEVLGDGPRSTTDDSMATGYASRCPEGCTHEIPGVKVSEEESEFTQKPRRFCQTLDYAGERRLAYAKMGYLDYDALNNDMFEPHSNESHHLQSFLAYRDTLRATFARLEKIEIPEKDRGWSKKCIPSKSVALPLTLTIPFVCNLPDCPETNHEGFSNTVSRLVGWVQVPIDQAWRGVIKRRDVAKVQYCEQGSGICNQYGCSSGNHCVRLAHNKLETVLQNGKRKLHHARYLGCLGCIPPCIGPTVIHEWTHRDWVNGKSVTGIRDDSSYSESHDIDPVLLLPDLSLGQTSTPPVESRGIDGSMAESALSPPPSIMSTGDVHSEKSLPASKLPRVTRACDKCKSRKRRCNGGKPCAYCIRNGVLCTYNAPYTRGKWIGNVRPLGRIQLGGQLAKFEAGNSLPASKRSRVTRACDKCKSRKRRCNGENPCAYCIEHDVLCTYDAPYTRGKRVDLETSKSHTGL